MGMIRREFTTGAGTVIGAEPSGGLTISHGTGALGLRYRANQLDEAVRAGRWGQAQQALIALEKAAAPVALDTLSKPDKRYLLGALLNAGETARREERWSVLEIVLSVLALGIPFLVDALDETEREEALQRFSSLEASFERRLAPGPLGELLDPKEQDISGHMNLVVENPLTGATNALAAAFGGRFQTIADRVASRAYSRSGTINTNDFERTAGVRLIDKNTRELISLHGQRYVRMELDGRAVARQADGTLEFSDGNGVPPEREAEIVRIDVPLADVVARLAKENDPPPRPNMPFVWRNMRGTFDVSWWGQCHASAMLGSLGVPAARHPVTMFDEQSGKLVSLSAEDVTNLVVLLGDSAFGRVHVTAGAGRINRAEKLDTDTPEEFHTFVKERIRIGAPFVLEAHATSQIWNYPIAKAEIIEEGPASGLFGRKTQSYVMRLTTPGGSVNQYFYSLTYDGGRIVGGEWDLERGHRMNGADHEVPDHLYAFIDEKSFEVPVRPGRGPESTLPYLGVDGAAAQLFVDLYFSARTEPIGRSKRVYVIRKADGTLQQVTQDELKARAPDADVP